MIVLRLTAKGHRRDLQFEGARVVLGSGPTCDALETDLGWAPVEAVVVHCGTEIELRRPGGGDLRLRVGDSVRLGHARVTLVGLLPLEDVATPAGGTEASEEKRAAAVLFGGYDEEGLRRMTELRFELADDPWQESAPPPQARPPTPQPLPKPDPPAKAASSPPPASPDRERSPAPATGPPSDASRPTTAPEKDDVPLPRPPTPAFGSPAFGEELVGQLKRAPFFAVSLAVHLLVFLVLSVLQTTNEADAREGKGGTLHSTLLATDPDDEEEVGEDVDLLEIVPPPFPETPTLADLPDEQALRLESTPEGGDDLPPLPLDDPPPFTTGLNPSLSSARAGTGRRSSRMTPRTLREGFTKGDAIAVNGRAADYIRGQLGRGPGRKGNLLETLARNDLLVVNSTFDKIEKVLHALRLPHIAVPTRSMALPNAPSLSQHKVIFWNCGETLPPEQRRIATRRLRKFVSNGGYLFTTDWCVANVLADAFPGYLASNGPGSTLPETIIDIRPKRGQENHPFLEGVFRRGVQGRWWLEQASFDILVLRRHEVTVLIESPDLKELYGRGTAVAVTFAYGRGRVLHVMGHYFQEAGNLAGTLSAQRLALNFVLMRLGRD